MESDKNVCQNCEVVKPGHVIRLNSNKECILCGKYFNTYTPHPAHESRRDAHTESRKRVSKDISAITELLESSATPLTAFEIATITGLHLLRVRPALSRLSRPDECLNYFGITSPIRECGRRKCVQSRHPVTAYAVRMPGYQEFI